MVVSLGLYQDQFLRTQTLDQQGEVFLRRSGVQIDAIQDRRLYNVEQHDDFRADIVQRCQSHLIPEEMHTEGTVTMWRQQRWLLPHGK